MRMITGPATVTRPGRTQLPYGLFSVLSPSTNGQRWESGGAQWETLTCEPVSGTPLGDNYGDLADELDGGLHSGEGTENVISWALPFAVHGYFTGSPVGHSAQEAQALAEEHLLAREQTRVEQAFWTGDLANIPNLQGEGYDAQDEPFPYSAPTSIGTFDPVNAVAELEDFIATMYGSLGVLHVPRKLAVYLLNEDLFHSRGGRLYTALDTPVVAGAGYTGDTMKATPSLFGFRSEVDAYVDATAGFDRSQNNLKAIASRSYLLGFDPCGTASVTVDLTGGNEGGEVTFPDSMDVNVTNASLSVEEQSPISSVSVSNMPATQDVNVTNTPLPVEEQGGTAG